MSAIVGWIATGVFTASYLVRDPGRLRSMQMIGAGIWVLYGCMIAATPVIVADLLSAATWAAWRRRPEPPPT